MHSLNLKVVTDFNARAWQSRLGVGSDPAGARRQWLNCKYQNVRLVKIVACSKSENSTPVSDSGTGREQNSVLSRTQTYALLKQQLEVAAKSEDYKEAARLRDSLKMFEEAEPVLRLKRLLKEAVAEEKFEDAARYLDELKEIAPHSLLKCSSDASTLKDVWSEEEDKILIEAHAEVGNKWSEIAKKLPRRTENSIKNHWNATKRRQFSRRKARTKWPRSSTLLQDYIQSLNLEKTDNRRNAESPSAHRGILINNSFQDAGKSLELIEFSPGDHLVPCYNFDQDLEFVLDDEINMDDVTFHMPPLM